MKKKIKWGNIGLSSLLTICASIVIHDIYMITIHAWITDQMCGWTLFGFGTFIIALTTTMIIGEYLYDEFTK